MTRRSPEGAFGAADTNPRGHVMDDRMTLDQALFQRDGYQRAYESCRVELDAARARVAALEAVAEAAHEAWDTWVDGLAGDIEGAMDGLHAALDAVPAAPTEERPRT